MKVLRIIARLNVGGPARHVIWLTRALQDEEFQSVLIAGSVPAGEEDMGYFAAENGVEPYYIREMSRELSLLDLVSLIRVWRRMVAEQPDIVHTHTAKAGTIGRIAAFLYRWLTWSSLIGKPRRVKVVHTFHGHVFHSYYGTLKTAVFLTIERLLARFVTDKIVVLSDQQRDEINGKFRVGRREQFAVIPLGIDTAAFHDARSSRERLRTEIGAAKDEIVIGYIGRLTEVKDLSLLLDAAALSRNDDPELRFIIVGDGHLRESLEREASSLKLGSNLKFLGNRRDIADIYAALDIVALTSLNEGTPLSLIEAMAAERPVISTAVGGVPGLLGEPVNELDGFTVCERGVLVISRQPADLKNGLIYLAKSERLRAETASRGLQFVVSNYGKQRLIDDVRELYRSIVSKSA
jgi:glycosyltransferase involved in cell wall biosynthesis